MKTSTWEELSPKSEFYLFVPRDEELFEHYEKLLKVTDIFPTSNVGIVTSRDSFVIDSDKETLKRRIRMFRDEKIQEEIIKLTFSLSDKSNWKVKSAREKIRNDHHWEISIIRILYRPFDVQWILYHDALIERSRKEVMRHMMQENLSLIFMRQVALQEDYTHFLVSEHIIDNRSFYSNKGIMTIAPLYLYPDTEKKDLFNHKQKEGERKPNFNPEFYKTVSGEYDRELSPEEIFYYIYAVLYSNTYRTNYAEFLKIDFPRVPFTKDYAVFSKLAELGEKLVNLHLLKSPDLDPPIAKFPVKGEDKVDKPLYKNGRVYINKDQYFEGVDEDVWEYQIGGYQVCHKWLKDRKGRKLLTEDIIHYCKVVTALKKTIEIQKSIDVIYDEVEKGLIEF